MSKYDPDSPKDIAARLGDLRKKLAARENIGAYAENCAAIRAEIARLEAL